MSYENINNNFSLVSVALTEYDQSLTKIGIYVS